MMSATDSSSDGERSLSPAFELPDSVDSSRSDSPVPPSAESYGWSHQQLPKGLPQVPLDETPSRPADVDQLTPDYWINRNVRLIRLTGKHPFNCEAPVADLYKAGFLTPTHLHFVRNHGYVPRVDDQKLRDWRIRVHGLVAREHSFSLQELKEWFEVVTLPVTLVCAGNRRKEQNVLRKSLGFDWGSSGLSTALWTGVYLADVLDFVKPLRGSAKHVVFEGDDQLPNGPYGTSQRLSWASNREKGMLIAWAMNGRPLEPDHGFPVRVLIPGQIGGRSVKWLTSIEVSAQESQHHLHFYDNKVIPTELTPEQAREQKDVWYDPKYIITELNVNSAIMKPDHDELLTIPTSKTDHVPFSTYPVRGYAYSGGGRRINRVEVSLDHGETWSLAKIEYPEDLFRSIANSDQTFGTLDLTERDTSFCWCLWTYEVPITNLANAHSITVRAMDEAMNIQPRDMYPNATSMMNNWWFRVAIVRVDGAVRFVHPAPVGTSTPGWMETMKASGIDYMHPTFGSTKGESNQVQMVLPSEDVQLTLHEITRKITLAELKAQDRKKPWFVIKGEVYDATAYLDDHPGGADSILLSAGDDATEDFMAIHSNDAKKTLQQFHIGTLTDQIESSALNAPESSNTSGQFLNPKAWKTATLVKVLPVNHDSRLFRFAAEQPLGLPIGQHVFVRLKCKDTGELVQRAYTPVSQRSDGGFIDLLVKLYLPNDHFPIGGKMSVALHRLQIGDTIEMKGPLGSFVWQGDQQALWKGVSRTVKSIGMICGGSGITPILQVLRGVLHDSSSDETMLWLLDANRTEADILCREELDELEKRFAGRFHVHYTIGVATQEWKYSRGRITDAMMATHLPPPSDDALILVCGPLPMINEVVKPGLDRLGWDIATSLVIF